MRFIAGAIGGQNQKLPLPSSDWEPCQLPGMPSCAARVSSMARTSKHGVIIGQYSPITQEMAIQLDTHQVIARGHPLDHGCGLLQRKRYSQALLHALPRAGGAQKMQPAAPHGALPSLDC